MSDGGQLCDRCHVRPAVAMVRHVPHGRPPVAQRSCDVCLEKGRATCVWDQGGCNDVAVRPSRSVRPHPG